jgi:hypothetical protein
MDAFFSSGWRMRVAPWSASGTIPYAARKKMKSALRRESFVSQKIVRAAVAIARGAEETLVLGDLSARIDWAYAPDFYRCDDANRAGCRAGRVCRRDRRDTQRPGICGDRLRTTRCRLARSRSRGSAFAHTVVDHTRWELRPIARPHRLHPRVTFPEMVAILVDAAQRENDRVSRVDA